MWQFKYQGNRQWSQLYRHNYNESKYRGNCTEPQTLSLKINDLIASLKLLLLYLFIRIIIIYFSKFSKTWTQKSLYCTEYQDIRRISVVFNIIWMYFIKAMHFIRINLFWYSYLYSRGLCQFKQSYNSNIVEIQTLLRSNKQIVYCYCESVISKMIYQRL